MDLQEKSVNSGITTKSVDLRGIISSLKAVRRGLSPVQAINMGIIDKTFDQYEKEIIGDIVRTRIRESWRAESVFPSF
ncbi:hypothetical protein [Eubacterium aggregans]|uniref:hypothetical protein n=1 Tax=Eubacterium aggregans TaxID=81409 RepID=UPI003F3BC177